MTDYGTVALIMQHENGVKVAPPEQIQIWMKQTTDSIATISGKGKFVGGVGLPFDE